MEAEDDGIEFSGRGIESSSLASAFRFAGFKEIVSSLCSGALLLTGSTFRVCDGRRLGSHTAQRLRLIFHIIRELHPLRREEAPPENELFSAPTAPGGPSAPRHLRNIRHP